VICGNASTASGVPEFGLFLETCETISAGMSELPAPAMLLILALVQIRQSKVAVKDHGHLLLQVCNQVSSGRKL
jgi:hypothetical protein